MTSYPKDVLVAWKKACEVRAHAHAPYSKFQVGAALKVKEKDDVIVGCNVENASFGATVCAERTAFQTAVAEMGSITPEWLVVVTESEPAVPPCALCLQIFAEFCDKDFTVYIANPKGIDRVNKFSELLHNPFGPADLEKHEKKL